MTKKILKNEMRYRLKTTVLCWAFILIIAVLVLITPDINEDTPDELFDILTMVDITYFLLFFATVAGLFFFTIGDYIKRYHKNPAYLTHTLPMTAKELVYGRAATDLIFVYISQTLIQFCDYCLEADIYFPFWHAVRELFDGDSSFADPLHLRIFEFIDDVFYIISCHLALLCTLLMIYLSFAIIHFFKTNKRRTVIEIAKFLVPGIIVFIGIIKFDEFVFLGYWTNKTSWYSVMYYLMNIIITVITFIYIKIIIKKLIKLYDKKINI